MSEHVTFGIEDCVGILSLNRPEKMNALTPQMREALIDYLQQAERDDAIRAVILRAEGERAFSAGADLGELGTRTWKSEMSDGARVRRALPRTIEEMGTPVIAALQGYVLGAGLEVAMACPIRIAAQSATFGLPELRHGVLPGSGGTQRLPRLIGLAWSMDMILTGRSIDAATALQGGLVSRVVAVDQLMSEARAVAGEIKKLSPFAVKAAKMAVQQSFRRDLDDDVEEERRLFALCLVDKESGAEGR
ncbi:MAG: enoyl-CoA hydratase/isomerase family protein [Vulcanimicrobiaceae bacterium]